MTEMKLSQLIDRAVELDREVAEKTEELKDIKRRLVQEAKDRPEERVAVEGVGSKWMHPGTSGCICRVTFPGARLKATINPETKDGQKAIALAGNAKLKLFEQVLVYKPLKDFRDLARQVVGGSAAEKLIRACESEASPSVAFETKPE